MNRSARFLLKFKFLVFPILVLLPITVLANDYQIPDIRIETELLEDGSVRITEHLTYVFDGSFSWADHRIPRRGFDDMTNIRVSESGQAYTNDNSESPGTFSVSRSDDQVIIKWHYSATDTSRTFTVSYELKGALIAGEEWVEFFWNYLGSGRNKSTDTFNLTVHPPRAVSPDSVYFWDRLEPAHELAKQPDGSLTIHAFGISRQRSAAFRFLFPRRIFDRNQVSVTDSILTLEYVRQQEADWIRERQEREEKLARIESISGPAILIISALSLMIFVFLYRKYGRRHSVRLIRDRETVMIPGRIPPALIAKLLNSLITSSNHVLATLFDLARRGFFSIQEKKKTTKGFFSDSEESEFLIERTNLQPDDEHRLSEWEAMLVRYVDENLQKGPLTIKKLFSKEPVRYSRWFTEWKKVVHSDFEEMNWIDKKSNKGVLLNLLLQVPLIAASIYFLFNEAMIGIAGLIITVIFTTLSFVIKRRTPEGEETYKRWKLYRKGLKNADERILQMEMLDRHFIYATAFGLSPGQIETLLKQAEEGQLGTVIPWIVLYHGSYSTPASIASSVSALAATGGSTFTGSVGGTGASVGAAGGGASSGAG